MKKLIYRIKRIYHFFKTGLLNGIPAQIRFNFPANKLKTIAITGTDGKTTTSTLVYHILNQANLKTGLVSTIAAKIGDKEIDTGLHTTAPSPKELNLILKQMVKEKCEHVVLEMTSHGVYQYRDWGIKPSIAGLTNVSHEHLDYHLTYNDYIDAKCLLLKKAPVAIINQDDKSFYRVKQRLDLKKQEVINYSLEEGIDKKIKQAIQKRFPEPYNQMNARLAVKITQHLKIPDQKIAAAISNFPNVPGRTEEVNAGQLFRVIVDFAHTPNALEQLLPHLKKQVKKNGKLIALFGATGLRDQSKRPIMGQIAAQYADLVVLTADDSRTENTWAIIQQIKSGITEKHNKILSIPNRYKAIELTLTKLAQPNDVVALMGKGPEKSLAIGKKEIPWGDKIIATQIIKEEKLDKNHD